ERLCCRKSDAAANGRVGGGFPALVRGCCGRGGRGARVRIAEGVLPVPCGGGVRGGLGGCPRAGARAPRGGGGGGTGGSAWNRRALRSHPPPRLLREARLRRVGQGAVP